MAGIELRLSPLGLDDDAGYKSVMECVNFSNLLEGHLAFDNRLKYWKYFQINIFYIFLNK